MSAGAIQPATVVAVALFLLVGLVIPGLLVWRDIRQERRRLAAPVPPAPTFTAYLSTLSGRLGFVPAQNEEICAEIEAHLWDTTEALVEEGLDVPDAKRQAMDQLGSPADLAVALRDARRERPQALATVGGGAMKAGGGFVYGGILAMVLFVPAIAVVASAVALLGELGLGYDDWAQLKLMWTMFGHAAFCVGLAIGSRRGVLFVSAAMHRPVRGVAHGWAIGGAAVIAFLVVFVIPGPLAWPVVGLLLAMPIATAIGALMASSGRRLKLTPRGIAALAIAATLLILPSVFLFGPREVPISTGKVIGAERLPPRAPYGTVPRTTDYVDRTGLGADCRDRDGIASCSFDLIAWDDPDATLSQEFSGLRAEVWAGIADSMGPAGVDGSAPGPILVAPVTLTTSELRASINLGTRRDGSVWWIAPTGVLPDGVRYRLSDGEGVDIPFRGTIVDWLNASG